MAPETNGEIDHEAMSRLVEIFGTDTVARLIDCCLEDIEASLNVVLAGSADRAPDKVRRGAHRLAGVLSQYACLQAAEQAARVSTENSLDALTQASDLIALARRCQMQLRMFRNGLPKSLGSHNPDSGSD